MESLENEPIALHVLVVGFHHKKGMQVEFAYPPLSTSSEENNSECLMPEKWKHLPSLCLPDGAHNHESDIVYFHLPHLTKDAQTVFGVSCYRQIDADKVQNRTADITRNTVQKSVCVLTTLPIYGYVQERLKVTTNVYFKVGDFSDVRDLEGLYHDLNGVNWKERLLHGICATDAVRVFGRNILVLFKLVLLERRVLFFNASVASTVKLLTSLLSLLPGNLPDGIAEAAASSNFFDGEVTKIDDKSKSSEELNIEEPDSTKVMIDEVENEAAPNHVTAEESTEKSVPNCEQNYSRGQLPRKSRNYLSLQGQRYFSQHKLYIFSRSIAKEKQESNYDSDELSERQSTNSSLTSVTSRGSLMSPSSFYANNLSGAEPEPNLTSKISNLKGRLSGAFNYWSGRDKNSVSDKPSTNTITTSGDQAENDQASNTTTTTGDQAENDQGEEVLSSPTSNEAQLVSDNHAENAHHNLIMEKYSLMELSECGLPLQIFTKGNLLHPYLSLQYLEVLTAPSTRGFMAGVSNSLFIHKRNLYEVLIQVDEGKIEVADPDLKKVLSLTTEDLRFADNLVRQVELGVATTGKLADIGPTQSTVASDVYLEGIGWLGGEEWFRHQFKVYLLSLLRASLSPEGSRDWEVFNCSFISALKRTHNYQTWASSGCIEALGQMPPVHPCAGNLSISDMRIKLSHTIQGLDRGRRLNQTIANTGTAVLKTKEAVGGALSSAKGAISTLWTSFSTPSGHIDREGEGFEEGVEAVELSVKVGHTSDDADGKDTCKVASTLDCSEQPTSNSVTDAA